jgi:hypothetical protein
MGDNSPFDAAPDAEIGAALREALAMPFGGAFVNRVRSRLNQRQRGWDDELASWFWQGLIAASLVTLLAGWGMNHLPSAMDETDVATATPTVSGQLLEGSTPGVNVLMASMTSADTP